MRIRIWIGLIVVLLVTLACGLPTQITETPQPTTPPLSQEAAGQIEDSLQATLNSPNEKGEVTVTITEAELNAYIQTQMADQQQDFPIQNMKVRLTEGKMELIGQVRQLGMALEARIVVVPTINADGKPGINILSAALGPLPLPDELLTRINDQADELLLDYLARADSQSLRVNSITITDGLITIVGQKQ